MSEIKVVKKAEIEALEKKVKEQLKEELADIRRRFNGFVQATEQKFAKLELLIED